MSLIDVSILLLAGGRGQRMGGQDKGLLEWRGQPLIAHLHASVRSLTDDLIISCNRNPQRYGIYADRLVTDDSDDFPGPLAGIRAGLAVARHSHLLVLPCDVPQVDRDLLQAMIGAAGRHPRQPLMVRQGEHWEPLLCVIPVALAGAFDSAWASGERSPRKVLLPLHALPLQCPADDPRLANLNTPQLLQHCDSLPDGHG
ncbi:molybdenum cofactor guanylyltransferase MobA [Pseudomonas gingeri]|uniref:Molybdenum cofactor guanylyltransferase n=1 Tax=Pseudomonas gingeri TaxID=117681 RepID=A0A7Y7Y8J2_9PSED|nr:molybdenum cofactor guanylyltransferase MobA [Pseudomonas gingeri]NWA00061.1 molybdenum cofactor guanylyltransferase MobA [Pseudomonas gingeri]NWA16900.1 molybdenum cofactor guanylyltransferase MobA [Pseudomonas gingeri]NWA53714.1 molybdenum cofactor guanylyltransferase MobA [Pseudomonas gingeri]NWA93946.1 molybdenum cofactor guanylyltransferase MobA [Pseudomonas gingeri]NWB02154.1 molybdenum cofactor guanylyltransferase MobA [Pseudomonas gingeri]